MASARIRHRDLIAVGASAGGAQTLIELVGGFSAELPAAVLVAQHASPSSRAVLAEILSRSGKLPATTAVDGEPIERGHIYVAPPDHHLLVGEERLVVTRGPRENGHRPAADPMFRSAARHYGQRVIAVVLSGALDDGSAGLIAVKARGGVAIAQDPQDALHSAMPKNAIDRDHPDFVVPVSELAGLLCTLVEERLRPARTNSQLGKAGHRFAPASLDQGQAQALEATLWTAVRGLYERGELGRRLARESGTGELSQLYLDRARAVEQQAEAIITAIQRLGSGGEQPLEGDREHCPRIEHDQHMEAKR